MPVLYLASKSPRRREILAGMGISDIEVIHAGPSVLTAFEGDETQHDGEAPQDYVVRTACEKARQAMDRIAAEGKPSLPVLAADTVVICGDEISKQLHVAVSVSQVTFSRLSSRQIEAYIRTDEPYDKAGGYAVQGLAGLFIERIEGSYSGIMGLPVFETAQLLAEVAPQLLPDCALTGC